MHGKRNSRFLPFRGNAAGAVSAAAAAYRKGRQTGVVCCVYTVLQQEAAALFPKNLPQPFIIGGQKGLGGFFAPGRKFFQTVFAVSALHVQGICRQADVRVCGLHGRQGGKKNLFLIKIGVLCGKAQLFPKIAGAWACGDGKSPAENKNFLGFGFGGNVFQFFLFLHNPLKMRQKHFLCIIFGQGKRHFDNGTARIVQPQAYGFVPVENDAVRDFLSAVFKNLCFRFGHIQALTKTSFPKRRAWPYRKIRRRK